MKQMEKNSRELLLQEYLFAQKISDESIPKPKSDEFEQIWKRIQDGHGDKK